MDVRVRTEPRGERCPICHAEDITDKPVIRCGGCGSVSHAECHTSNGGCSTIGCDRSRAPTRTRPVKEAIAPKPVSCKYNVENCTSTHGNEGSDVSAQVASEFTLRRQLPLLGAILLVPSAVMFLAWLIVQIIHPFFEGRYLAGSMSVLGALGGALVVKALANKIMTRTGRHEFSTWLLLVLCPYILFVLLIWLAAR